MILELIYGYATMTKKDQSTSPMTDTPAVVLRDVNNMIYVRLRELWSLSLAGVVLMLCECLVLTGYCALSIMA